MQYIDHHSKCSYAYNIQIGGGGGPLERLECENAGLWSELGRESGGLRNWLCGTRLAGTKMLVSGTAKNYKWWCSGAEYFSENCGI